MRSFVEAYFFTPVMPEEQARARYKALSRVLHPDVQTGDTELMKRVNAEYDAFCNKTLIAKKEAIQIDLTASLRDEIKNLTIANQKLREENAQLQITNNNFQAIIDQYDQDVIWRLPEFDGVSYVWIQSRDRIVALGQTYDCKEDLKTHGFRWDPGDRVWYLEVF